MHLGLFLKSNFNYEIYIKLIFDVSCGEHFHTHTHTHTHLFLLHTNIFAEYDS